MRQKAASGSDEGQGQRPAWQHRFVAAAGILTRLISVRGCQRQGSPCVREGQQPRLDCTSVPCSYTARAGPWRTILSWKLLIARRKENRLLNTESENWTSHLTTVSGVVLKVRYWDRSHLPAWFYYYQHWYQSHEHGSLGWETFRR